MAREIFLVLENIKNVTENLTVAQKWARVNNVIIHDWYANDAKTLLRALSICRVSENYSAIVLHIGNLVYISDHALNMMREIRAKNPRLPIILIWPNEKASAEYQSAVITRKNDWRSLSTEVVDGTGKSSSYTPWLERTLDFVEHGEIFDSALKELARI